MDSHGFVSANVMHSQQNGDSYSTSYSNTAFDDRLSWGVQGSTTDRQDSAAGVNAARQGDKMNVQGGYSAGRNYQNMNMGISGGAMLHAGGVTLMHSPGDTMVLVEAQNADGVHIQQQNGVAIDGNGYAVLTAADAALQRGESEYRRYWRRSGYSRAQKKLSRQRKPSAKSCLKPSAGATIW